MLKIKILGFEMVYAKNFTSFDGNALTFPLSFHGLNIEDQKIKLQLLPYSIIHP